MRAMLRGAFPGLKDLCVSEDADTSVAQGLAIRGDVDMMGLAIRGDVDVRGSPSSVTTPAASASCGVQTFSKPPPPPQPS